MQNLKVEDPKMENKLMIQMKMMKDLTRIDNNIKNTVPKPKKMSGTKKNSTEDIGLPI